MDKKKLARMIATAMACLGMGVFAFAGCDTADNGNGSDEKTEADGGPLNPDDKDQSGGGNEEGTSGNDDGNGSSGEDGNGDEGSGSSGEGAIGDAVIPEVPAGNVKITEAKGDLEAGYVKWSALNGADWYNVYVKPEDGEYKKIDNELVRQYKSYFRADTVGLKAGKYTMKVVPTTESVESENLSATAEFTVLAHERSGFGFVDGTSSGAYNEDGTLKSNAKVIYVTENNKNTVTLSVSNGKTEDTITGVQNIITAYKKDNAPLSIRFIGNVGDPADMPKGDLYLDGLSAGVTVEGIGDDATANGWGIVIKNTSNLEVRNLGFMNCDSTEGDDVGLQQSNDHIWVHNCDFFYGDAGSDADQVKGDGALDTKKSTYVTHSYNHFWDNGKCNLQGMKDESTDNKITYHHNWYDHSDSRHPRIRTCTVHIYNNYFDGNAKYCVGVTLGASAFVENNYFRSTAKMNPMLSSGQGTDAKGAKGTFSGEDGGIIKAYGNTFVGSYDLITQKTTSDKTDIDCYLAETRDEVVSSEYTTKKGGTTYNNFDTASDFYSYEVDSPEVAKQKIEKYAGRINGGDLKWTFDNAKEDSNYTVIPGLKAKLTAYKNTEILKVAGVTVTGVASGSNATTGGDTGDGDGEGGTTGGSTLPEGTSKIEFLGTATYPEGVTVTGTYKDKTGYLKMESSTKVTVNFNETKTVTIHCSSSGKIKVNGTSKDLNGSGELTVTVQAGTSLIIEKGDSMNLMYILIA